MESIKIGEVLTTLRQRGEKGWEKTKISLFVFFKTITHDNKRPAFRMHCLKGLRPSRHTSTICLQCLRTGQTLRPSLPLSYTHREGGRWVAVLVTSTGRISCHWFRSRLGRTVLSLHATLSQDWLSDKYVPVWQVCTRNYWQQNTKITNWWLSVSYTRTSQWMFKENIAMSWTQQHT